MRILSVNINNNYNFKARRKDVREADKIVRNVNLQFPAFSPTYVKYFWHPINDKKFQIIKNPIDRIDNLRNRIESEREEDKFVLGIFDEIKKNKTANCEEKSWLTLGALGANGYNSAIKSAVGLKWSVIDKRDKKTILEGKEDLDHSVIVARMTDKKNVKPQDLVVLDPWLNKAMSYSEAQREYFKLFNKEKTAKIQKKFLEKIKEENPDGNYDISNYKFILNIIFFDHSSYRYNVRNKEDVEEFGEIVAQKYPELILDKKDN